MRCLLTALRFHKITAQNPPEVWTAVGHKDRTPKIDYPALQVVRMSSPARTEGIEEHDIEGASARVYGSAKTAADCFKFRSKVGLDAAIEALRDCYHQ